MEGNEPHDLFMAPVKKEEWRNGYRNSEDNIFLAYPSYSDPSTARECADNMDARYVGPVKTREWEE